MTLVCDSISGEWSLRAPLRRERPNEYTDGVDDRCAFCPGSEDLTTAEITRTERAPGSWSVRVFSNKYPAIAPPAGLHEIIVDGPDHAREMTAAGVHMWFSRYCAALEAMPRSFPVIFKNSGERAGATQVHPHTQMVVVSQRPPRWSAMGEAARKYRATNGRCAWCDRAALLESNVFTGPLLRAYVHQDARVPGTLTVLPVECRPAPDRASRQTTDSVASLLERVAGVLGGAAAFNVSVNADPHAPDFHWHVDVIPRRSTIAGFELTTGILVGESEPKESAERWRRMLALPDGPV